MAYRGLKLEEPATADFEQVLQLEAHTHQDWRGRGLALYELKRYEEAIVSFDKALEISPDYYYAWIFRGFPLDNLGEYEEAIASYDKALEISPDEYDAWIFRGYALYKLWKYEEAIASYDKAIEINLDEYDAWINRGWALFNLKRYEETFQNWEDGREHLNLDTPEHREGRGQLYYNEAKAYYQLGRQESNFDKLLKAEGCYQKAFKLLDTAKCRQRQLEILQDLIRVCQYISTPKRVKELLNQSTDLLERWLQDSNFSDENYIHFKQKFAGFNQYQVDTLAQSSEPEQHIQALELAEERKNTCLGWLQHGKTYKAPNLTYNQIQQQLNPHTAAIYWHISPAAITTFILKHNQPPQILQLQPLKSKKKRSPFTFFNQPEKSYPEIANQLREFEDWLERWKQDYRHYSQA